MNKPLEERLHVALGVKDAKAMAAEIRADKSPTMKLYRAFLAIAQKGEGTPAMKAAWVLSKLAEQDGSGAKKFAAEILDVIEASRNGGIQRELMRVLMIQLPNEDIHGRHIDICMRILPAAHLDVAVRYNALRTLEKYVRMYPDLWPEFAAVVEANLEQQTPTWQNVAKRFLAKRP